MTFKDEIFLRQTGVMRAAVWTKGWRIVYDAQTLERRHWHPHGRSEVEHEVGMTEPIRHMKRRREEREVTEDVSRKSGTSWRVTEGRIVPTMKTEEYCKTVLATPLAFLCTVLADLNRWQGPGQERYEEKHEVDETAQGSQDNIPRGEETVLPQQPYKKGFAQISHSEEWEEIEREEEIMVATRSHIIGLPHVTSGNNDEAGT